ncbi:MAG: hypothetical protein CME05_09450 [Gemmatimonadaceae bacterium]|nr:hypothetical protein [Gemmatimonadaceae bacterium]
MEEVVGMAAIGSLVGSDLVEAYSSKTLNELRAECGRLMTQERYLRQQCEHELESAEARMEQLDTDQDNLSKDVDRLSAEIERVDGDVQRAKGDDEDEDGSASDEGEGSAG